MNKYEFKGTQGEWKLENRYVKAGYRLTPIAEPHGLLPIDENDANLNLIAAAPELLQACVLTLWSLGMHNIAPQSQHTLRQAIHRALNLPTVKK